LKRTELLSPAGSMQAFYQAIHNGADAIYLGGKSFGARSFAENFSNLELEECVNYAHLYSKKIYITIFIRLKLMKIVLIEYLHPKMCL
jgi:U32 family peptidase